MYALYARVWAAWAENCGDGWQVSSFGLLGSIRAIPVKNEVVV